MLFACIWVRLYNLACTFHLGWGSYLFVWSAKGKLLKVCQFLNKNPFMKMLIHAVSLFSTERGWKQARNTFWSSRSYGAVLIIRSLNPSFESLKHSGVFETNWIRKPFSSEPHLFSCKQHVRVLLWDSQAVCLPVSPGLALFHWMSQFLIDVFSKALLVQSLPVLVFFREITNCSANPSQSSHSKLLEEPVLRTAPRYLGEKCSIFDDCSECWSA